MRQVAFLSSPDIWQRGHGPDHPLKPERLQRTHELLAELGAFDLPNVSLIAPRIVKRDELTLFHTDQFVSIVRALSDGDTTVAAGRYGFGPGDNPIFLGMYESEGLKVGSAIHAAELLMSGDFDVAFSYSGGLHHGGLDFASGFCVFNDAAVAIHWLLERGQRVAYVDIDVHHGDGVQNAFYYTEEVLTISLHQDGRTLFPGTGFVNETGSGKGKGTCVNIPLPPYTDDEAYLWAFRQIVPQLLERFNADIVVTQLGVDTHVLDPLANLAMTTAGQESLYRELRDLAPRWLALGGGGYDINVVPRSWALALGMMAEISVPEKLPEQYQVKYGGEWLRDQEMVNMELQLRQRVLSQIEETVASVKRIHNIQRSQSH